MITAEELRKTFTIKGVRNIRRGMEAEDAVYRTRESLGERLYRIIHGKMRDELFMRESLATL